MLDHGDARTGMAVAAAALIALLGTDAAAGTHIKRTLHASGVDADAKGTAALSFSRHDGKAKLTIQAKHLDASASFDVVLDGVKIGTLATNDGGKGKAKFSSEPEHHDQPLGVDPRGKRLEVKNGAGEDVLDDDVPADTVDPNAVVCCRPHHDTIACELEDDAAECAEDHGTVVAGTSCLPNPCPTTSPDLTRCCAPGDDEDDADQTVKCKLVTAAECSDRHGTDVGAGSCDPNPCGTTSPDVIRCCVAEHEEGDHHGKHHDDGGPDVDCEQMTADHCAAVGGTPDGTGACRPNPCGSPSGAFVEAAD